MHSVKFPNNTLRYVLILLPFSRQETKTYRDSQLVSGKIKIQTQAIWLESLCS